MPDLIKLYLFALRSGDRPLARALAERCGRRPRCETKPTTPCSRCRAGQLAGPRALNEWSAAYDRAMKREVEERAERALASVPDWIWNGDTLPVPVEHIVDSCFGLHVRDVGDLSAGPGVPSLAAGQSLSGLLLPGVGEIWVNAAEARDWPARRRFTISHELGHWCLHRDGGAVWCRSQTVDPAEGADAPPRRAYPPEESEANEFAAAMLMPGHLVQRHYERLRRRDPDGCFGQLCRIFGASGAAMSRRLRSVAP